MSQPWLNMNLVNGIHLSAHPYNPASPRNGFIQEARAELIAGGLPLSHVPGVGLPGMSQEAIITHYHPIHPTLIHFPNATPQPHPLHPAAASRQVESQGAGQVEDIGEQGRRWGAEQMFSKDKMHELDEFMKLVELTYIQPQQIQGREEIAKGSYGSIFEARFDKSPAVVKEVSRGPGPTFRDKMHEIFLELNVLVRIRHPYIINFWGTVAEFPHNSNQVTQPYVGLVFELCPSGSLHNMLHQLSNQSLSVSDKVRIANQVAHGLQYLHTRSRDENCAIIHRNITPSNILLTSSLTAKIADFGTARLIFHEKLKTTSQLGSPPYMAPEQLIGDDLSCAADVWGFAVVVWEMMTDSLPWGPGRHTIPEMINKLISKGEALELSSSAEKDFPEAMVAIVRRSLKLKPEERPTMNFIAGELDRASRGRTRGR